MPRPVFVPLPDDNAAPQGGGGPAPSHTPPPPPPAPSGGSIPDVPNVPVEQMTPEQQAAYWRARARQHEDRSRELHAWREANEPKVSDYDRLIEASKSEHDRAIEAARAEAAKEGRTQLVPHLVAAEFLAAAKGALTREQVADLLAPLDKTYFLDPVGNVDTAKVSEYVAKAAPTAAAAAPPQGAPAQWPDTGQGRRGAANTSASVQAGRDLYQRMKNPQTT